MTTKAKQCVVYKQKYRKEWESLPYFKGWLSNVPGNEYKALCNFCHVEIHPHHRTLLKHASSVKHMKKEIPAMNELAATQEPQELDTEESYDDPQHESEQTTLETNIVTLAADLEADLPHSVSSDDANQFSTHDVDCMNSTQNTNVVVNNIELSETVVNNITRHRKLMKRRLLDQTTNIIKRPFIIKTPDTSDNLVQNMLPPEPSNCMPMKRNLQCTFCISTKVIECSKGMPAADLSTKLYEMSLGDWIQTNDRITDSTGKCLYSLVQDKMVTSNYYKLRYNTAEYYRKINIETCYPFVEVTFQTTTSSKAYHIYLMMSPFGYTVSQINND